MNETPEAQTNERRELDTCDARERREFSPRAARELRGDGAPRRTQARRAVQLCVLVVASAVVMLNVVLGSRASSNIESGLPASSAVADANDTGASPTLSLDPAQQQPTDFSKFSHTNPMHARLPCLLCHRRETNSTVPMRSLGHSPCAGCHAQQFGDPRSPICTICHTETDSAKPPVKPFPKLQSFGFTFDHARHTAGAARASCATCHKPSGRSLAALSIPSGASAHATCFRCHTPQSVAPDGRDISSCDTCHRLGRPTRVSVWSSAYTSTPFSHAAHARGGLACAECHAVRAGASLARQVSAPFPAQHHAPAGTKSCASCHDDRRAFGGEDFKDCTRCHRGKAWHF